MVKTLHDETRRQLIDTRKMKDFGCIAKAEAASSDSGVEDDLDPLYCWDCNVSFTSRHYLYNHLLHHVKQPYIHLRKVSLPPLKITLKNRSGNSFEIVSSSPGSSPPFSQHSTSLNLDGYGENKVKEEAPEEAEVEQQQQQENPSGGVLISEVTDEEEEAPERASITFSPNFAVNGEVAPESPANSVTGQDDSSQHAIPLGLSTNLETADKIAAAIVAPSAPNSGAEYGGIPGAEPTPPPEPSPDYPKIRIKTTGLLKESLTITEITDDNPNGDSQGGFMENNPNNMWNSRPNSMEDPLKLPENDNNLMTLFNNNERAKDLGFTTSDTEFISLDRLDDRNRGAMQLYNPNAVSTQQNSLESITGLPMQALAQQVSRLQPNSNNGMHQQNVLINIQQFPQAPPQPTYQPPPMYHHPPHPQQMYQPYQPYQPPNPYYPQPPGYPPQHMPPPPNPMTQLGQPPPPMNQHQMNQQQNQIGQPPLGQSMAPPSSQSQNMPPQIQPPNMQPPNSYRPHMPAPRQGAPRHPPPPGQRPMGPRQPMQPRSQMGQRQRTPLIRPRPAMQQGRGGMRPRMVGPPGQNGIRAQSSPIKRTPEQLQALQAKKKRVDMFNDKDDDDCQVISMQPKNTDGGLPQIESVQGGQSEPAENSIMHLSDSITLSVRNPPPKPVETPKKSDAKAVANVLASRGITVTATPKPKEKETTSSLPSSLNLNGAVSIIPAAKPQSKNSESQLPTVDLTDDSPEMKSSSQKGRAGLPFKCDLCPAQYPNAVGLGKHRQNFHKTSNGMPELGIPLINLKQPGVMHKLSTLGIVNYIPLPASGADGTFAIPIINSRNPGNVGALGASSMITLGPVKSIPKPVNSVNSPVKQMSQK